MLFSFAVLLPCRKWQAPPLKSRTLIIGVTLVQLADLALPLAKMHAQSRSYDHGFSQYEEAFVKQIAAHKRAYVISNNFEAPNLNSFAILTALVNVPITQARLARRDRSVSIERHEQIQKDIKTKWLFNRKYLFL